MLPRLVRSFSRLAVALLPPPPLHLFAQTNFQEEEAEYSLCQLDAFVGFKIAQDGHGCAR